MSCTPVLPESNNIVEKPRIIVLEYGADIERPLFQQPIL